MADYEMTFDDAHAFAAKMAKAPSLVENEMEHAVDRLTLQGEAQAKRKVPVRTGHLRRSIASRPAVFAGGTVTGSFGTATPYAKQVEFGGTITAKNGGYLKFPGQYRNPKLKKDGTPVANKNPGMVFVKSVTQKGRPYMEPARRYVEGLMPGEFKRAMQNVIAQLEGE
jgi:hypothetical protein